MATPLDIGLLGNFQIIFPFLFVFCIVFGVLSYSKFMGDNRILHATIGIVFAFMTLFSDLAVETINTASPWFVILFIFIIFIMMAFMILGVREGDFIGVLRNPEYGYIILWIIALVMIIVLGSLSHVMAQKKGGFPPFDDEAGVNGSGVANLQNVEGQEGDFWQTLFHPKVLGMVAIMMIAFFSISRLTRTS